MNETTRLRVVKAGLILAGIAFLSIGMQGLFAPKPLLWKVHMRLDAVDSLNEARAMYGGLNIALGSLFFFGLSRPTMHRTLVKLWTFLLAGLMAGRLVSVALDGFPPGIAQFLLALNATGLVLGLVLLRFCPKTPAVTSVAPAEPEATPVS